MARLEVAFQITAGTRILDIGGTPEIWSHLKVRPHITFANIEAVASSSAVVADGRRLPFRDGVFDLVFSNSVIEHVGDWNARESFAHECRRVGRRYYVQTPDQSFPIEPHCIAPFVHWLPVRAREMIVRFTPRGFIDARAGRPTTGLAHIELLTHRQMERLFPEARIWRERFCGLSKSLIAVRL